MSQPPRIVWGQTSETPAQPPAQRRSPRRLAPTPTLDHFGRDLTFEAHNGRFDHLIVRENLVRDIARVLLRSSKGNPVLVGDAGVGKTALVEVLARQLVNEPQPERLQGLRVVELPVTSLVAGSSLRGSLEQRLLQILDELRARPDIVIFMDEIHVLAAGQAESTVADILKPALARDQIRVIGATTAAEYDRHIRREPTLTRRFTPIEVAEPSAEETSRLLGHRAPRLATHHGVAIDPAAIEAAITLSIAYQRDRRLPDKAMDLLEDACTHAILPEETGPTPADGRPLVTAEMVAMALAGRTGIPLHHLTSASGERPREIEQDLRAAVFGQDKAVAAVAATVRLSRLGLRPEERPRGVFLFGGPSGVGKTALARALATAMSGSESALLRIDLSEYQEPHSVSRLIGSPPGYVGHDSGGQLTRWLQRQPSSVVLLDEFEKAHPRVLDLFLQVFDAGRLTDGLGQTVDARHAWFILTTNLPIEHDLATLKTHLRPEFLNRIDHVVEFDPLALPNLLDIAQREVETLRRRLGPRIHSLRVEPLALIALCNDESDGRPANGRTILRAVEASITTPLSILLAAHEGDPPNVLVEPLGGGVEVSLADGPPVAPEEASKPIVPGMAAAESPPSGAPPSPPGVFWNPEPPDDVPPIDDEPWLGFDPGPPDDDDLIPF